MSDIVKSGDSVQGLLSSENIKTRLQEILGKRASTFATSVIQITNQNEMLSKATPQSIVGAAMTAATLNLPLNNSLGYAYIIPYNNKQKDGSWKTVAQFQIGYKGFIQLAMRSGQFKTIHSTDIRQGEIIKVNRLTGEMEYDWIEDEDLRNKTKTIGYVAYFRLLNGYEATLYMTMDELNTHGKKFSQTFKKNYGLWKDEFDSMAKKTVLKLLLSKYAPLSIDMQTAVQKDQASFNDVDDTEDVVYVDNDVVDVNPDSERIRLLVDSIKTEEDIEFAREHITEEFVDDFKKKIKEVNKKSKKK